MSHLGRAAVVALISIACSSERPDFGAAQTSETETSSAGTDAGDRSTTSSPGSASGDAGGGVNPDSNDDTTEGVAPQTDASSNPTTTDGNTDSDGATEPDDAAEPDESTDSDESTEPDESTDSDESTEPVESTEPDSSTGCTNECELGTETCSGGSPQICVEADSGCTEWDEHPDCSSCDAPSEVEPKTPMRGAYTGSLHAPEAQRTLRPRLTWDEAQASCSTVTYQVQLDDSCAPGELQDCAFESPEVDTNVTAPEFQVSDDLPVSTEAPVGAMYAWRVRACTLGDACSDWSSVAYLHVGRTEQDINGDGYADMLLAGSVDSSLSVIEVYEGGPIFNRTQDTRIELEYSMQKPPRFVGDVNGDGFGDLVLAESATDLCSSSGMNVGIIYGAADASEATTDHLCRTQGTPSVMLGFAHSGDLDGDGFADIVVAHDLSSTENRVYVLQGGDPLPTTPAADMDTNIGAPYPLTETAGVAMAGAGDFNGDSYPDVVLSASRVSEEFLVSRLYLGGAELAQDFADEQEYDGCSTNVWNALLGDVTGDGKDDWAITCSGADGSQFGVLSGGDALPSAKASGFDSEVALQSGFGGIRLR